MATLLSAQTLKTKHYQTDQQVKYLHLEAEVDMLLQKLTTLKQQKPLFEWILAKTPESSLKFTK